MGKNRQRSGHIPEREKKNITPKEFNEVKRENQQLRRKLSRAEKQLARFIQLEAEAEEITEEEMAADLEEYKGAAYMRMDEPKCPKCEGLLSTLILLGNQYQVCKSCKYRQKITA